MVLLVSTIVSFLLSPLVVNSLGSVYYGIWALVNQFSGYLWLFDFGVRESVVKYVAQYHASGEPEKLEATVRTAVSVYLVVTLGVLGIVGVLVALLPHFFNIPVEAVPAARIAAFVAGANVAQTFLTNVFVGVLMGLQRIYLISQASVYSALLRLAGTYLLVTNGYGIVSLAFLQLALSLGFAVFIVGFCVVTLPEVSFRPMRPERSEVKRLLNYGKYVLLANLGDKFVFATDAIVIGMFLPIAALTPFAIAGTLIHSMRLVVKAMASVFNPLTSSLRASGSEVALQRVLQSGAKGAMIVGLPICIGFIILGERFVLLWIGEAHARMAWQIMTVLSVGYIVGLPYYTISGILYGLGEHRIVAILRIVEGVINLTLSVVLVKTIGLVGVALATAIPHIVIVGWVLPRALPKIFPVELRPYYAAVYGQTLIAAIPFGVACWLVRTVVQPAGLLSFFLWGSATLIAYAVPAWFVALSHDERTYFLRTLSAQRAARSK